MNITRLLKEYKECRRKYKMLIVKTKKAENLVHINMNNNQRETLRAPVT